MIELQYKNRNAGVKELFEDVIKTIQKTYCPCQGASFFMWDAFFTRYNLIATTGLKKGEENRISYNKGVGLTGMIGQYGNLYISDDLKKLRADIHHESKSSEIVEGDNSTPDGKGQCMTGMFIPIAFPSNKQDVVGVLRLINKKNKCNEKIVDFFSDVDAEIMRFASSYLSVVVDSYINLESQGNLIARMTHEILTPANSIWKSANSLFDNLENDEFLGRNLRDYLSDIIDFSEFQKWQVSTNMFLAKVQLQQSFDHRYQLEKCSLFDIIMKSRSIAIPIAKKYKLTINNIWIDDALKMFRIYVDKNAFITVFYNLLTNAIKYHDANSPFYINVSYSSLNDWIIIRVEDSGIGINEDEKESIFQSGYRGKMAIKMSSQGFGVGLPVVKQILDDFWGDICITSLSKPTIFTIKLPKKILI